MIESMTVRELAAQCVLPRIAEGEFFSNAEYREKMFALVREGVGGFCVFAGSMMQTAKMIGALQKVASVPLLCSGDFEFGLPMRLDEGTAFPHAMALGKGNSLPMTFRAGECIAREMKTIGVLWNFAPVCDVNSNKSNPVINIRSFGETPELVSAHSAAFIAGTQSENVIACAKHFPGHGDTSVDSHLSLPLLEADGTRLRSFEFAPFRAAIRQGVQSVMVGHLSVPALDDSGLPASLSRKIITDILRNELGFSGIIVSDALDMKAITQHYSAGTAATMAISAGNDVVLLPENPLGAIDALERAMQSGEISVEQVRNSVRNIIGIKRWCGAIPPDKADDKPVQKRWNIGDHKQAALDAAKAALEWHGEWQDLVPIEQFLTVAGFAFVEEQDMDSATNFFRYLSQCYENDCDFAYIDANVSDEDLAMIAEATGEDELVIFAIFARAQGGKGTVEIPARFYEIAPKLAQGRPVIAVLFGNPYLRETFPANAYLLTYSASEPSLGAAAVELARGGTKD